MAEDTYMIRLVQLPVIEEQLLAVKESVDRRTGEAAALVCTVDNLGTAKALRTELGRTFKAMEDQRKDVKKALMEPYDAFEAVYRKCVSNAFNEADRILKGKINAIENELKGRCEEGLREYFSELCAVYHLEWLAFESAGITVDMASARQKAQPPKKLADFLFNFVTMVADDVSAISGMEDREEILVEFKRSLCLSQAVAAVQERKRQREREREAFRRREEAMDRERQAVALVEEAAQIAVGPPEVVPVVEDTGDVLIRVSLENAIKVCEFMKREGIHYEWCRTCEK